MKKLVTIILSIIIFGCLSFAQTIRIHTNAGIDEYNLSDIDSITFDVTTGTSGGTVTDIDGNVYEMIQIGAQVWMAENLKVTHYRDGTAITNVSDNATWAALTTEAYCIFNNNASNEVDTYGALYNWYAISDSRNIAPVGWHVPTENEWIALEMYLGMSASDTVPNGTYRGTNEGSKLAGYRDLWMDGDLESDSEFGSSGFTALPSGYRYDEDGGEYGIGYHNYFWTATEITGQGSAFRRGMSYTSSGIYADAINKRFGCAVRLIRD